MDKSYSEEYDKISPDEFDEYKALNNKNNLTDDQQIHKEELMRSLSNQMNKAIAYGKFKQSVDGSQINVIDLLEKTLSQLHHKINKQDVMSLSVSDQEILKQKLTDFHQYLDQLASYLNQDDKPIISDDNPQD